jgi:hypothetical protein
VLGIADAPYEILFPELATREGHTGDVDCWGDMDHDWPWWWRMLPHYLERLGV